MCSTAPQASGSWRLPIRNFSVNADAVRFVPVVVESLEITGPATVNENATASTTALAHCSGGILVPVQPQVWTENVAQAGIDATGLLTTTSVSADTPAVITAQYTVDGTTVSDTHNITILNSGATPVEVIVDNLSAGHVLDGLVVPSSSPGLLGDELHGFAWSPAPPSPSPPISCPEPPTRSMPGGRQDSTDIRLCLIRSAATAPCWARSTSINSSTADSGASSEPTPSPELQA